MQQADAVVSDCQLNVYNFETLRNQPPARYQALRFDPNNTCNLHCVYCHNHRSDQIIEADALKEFLATRVLGVSFFQVGCIMEPTLDRRLTDLVVIIGESRARPDSAFVLQTNGLLLHRHDHARMADAGLTNLSVSLDTADPQMQRELRSGMSLSKVVRNIETFRNAAPNVSIELISVVTSSNIGQMDDLVELGLGVGATRVVFREVIYYPENNVVDHTKMPALLLRAGEFKRMEDRIRARFGGRLELLFAPNEMLDASARRMVEDSHRASAPPAPQLHQA